MYYLKTSINKPLLFASAGNFIADTGWKHIERTIDNYEIIVGLRGMAFIQQDNEKYALGPGDILLLLPGHIHKGYAESEKGTSFYWVHFTCSEACDVIDDEAAAAEIGLTSNNPYFEGLNNSILIPAFSKALQLDRISVLFHQLLHLSQAAYYTNHSVNYMCTSLLIEITEQSILSFRANIEEKLQADKLQKLLQWIGMHTMHSISLQDVAYEFNYSKEYLARYFKKRMGMSMQEYIYKLKISKAKELLCHSNKNIKDIAHLLGFQDEKYFMKLFKRYQQTTPKQFRNAYHLTHLNNT